MGLLAACSGGGSSTPTTHDLGPAFCADARAGLSPFQLYEPVADDWSLELFAEKAYGWITTGRPEVLPDWEGFLASWGAIDG